MARIAVIDYSGHPFQVELTRALAARGHDALHLHFAEFQTPKGNLQAMPSDPATFRCEAVSLGRPFAKYTLFKRARQETEIGRRFVKRLAAFAPDFVIAANMPLDALSRVVRARDALGYGLVFWQQDIYSVAIKNILSKRFGLFGWAVGHYYHALEKRILDHSDEVVAISSGFLASLEEEFEVPPHKIHVIENWAPLHEITPQPKQNAWSVRHGLVDQNVVLYTGTLGLKHDPEMILTLAEALRGRARTKIVVASEGLSADWLKEQAAARHLENLLVLPFQPYEVYPSVLGSADVLISILEADAGRYSVPSKILSYLCAGRSIVLSAPRENLATQTVTNAEAGACTMPGARDEFVAAVAQLLDDPARRTRCAANARRYAERNFDIERIADRFEGVLRACRDGRDARIPDPLGPIVDVSNPSDSKPARAPGGVARHI